MAKIRGRARHRDQLDIGAFEGRGPFLPGWAPLALALAGVGILLQPLELTWPLRVLGLVLLGIGAFWLGQDRQHDPRDRSRIGDLERQLMRLGILDRDLAFRRDLATTARGDRGDHDPEPAQPLEDADQQQPPRRRAPERVVVEPRSFDDALPGEPPDR